MGSDSPKLTRSRKAWVLQGACVLVALVYVALSAWIGGFLSSEPKEMGVAEWTCLGAGGFMLLMVVWLEFRISEQKAFVREGVCTRAMVYRKEPSRWSRKRMRVKYFFRLENRLKIKGRIVIRPSKLRYGPDGAMMVFYDPQKPQGSRLDVSLWAINCPRELLPPGGDPADLVVDPPAAWPGSMR